MHELLMRPNDNFQPAPDLKMTLFLRHAASKAPKDNVVIFDDREDVCKIFMDAGYVAMQIHRKANYGS
jgi:hypothetical protein